MNVKTERENKMKRCSKIETRNQCKELSLMIKLVRNIKDCCLRRLRQKNENSKQEHGRSVLLAVQQLQNSRLALGSICFYFGKVEMDSVPT